MTVGMTVVVASVHNGKWSPYVGTVVQVPEVEVVLAVEHPETAPAAVEAAEGVEGETLHSETESTAAVAVTAAATREKLSLRNPEVLYQIKSAKGWTDRRVRH
jgi:hypothetical protein